MLEVSHLTKKYGKLAACNGISFALDDGSITVLLGPNGAGKSTLMKSVIGFLKYEGSVTVGGFPNKSVEARRIMGYIPELPALYPNLTVSEHMEFLARAYKLENYKDRVKELFDTFELSDKTKKFGDELSKGMQQKLNLCLGLLPDPKLLLMDEPMIGLDPHAIKQLKATMEDMRAQGKTVLVSTHIIDSVDMIWDRTIIMQNGAVKANVTKAELDASGKTLEELFFEVTEGIGREDVSAGAVEEDKEPAKKPGLFGGFSFGKSKRNPSVKDDESEKNAASKEKDPSVKDDENAETASNQGKEKSPIDDESPEAGK